MARVLSIGRGRLVVGAYALRGTPLDVWTAIGAGLLGYAMRVEDYPLAPMVLGLILGPIAEVNLRRSLQLSGGELSSFADSPLAMVILGLSLISLAYPIVQRVRERRTAEGSG
mgnify:FL=1